ncbi:MAG: hypothetical protein LBD60_03525 [Puniceicoccales bacterium]|jgi:hypothetical protein|nr:hypothetical protein [Puniceicoccales bacterium]
MSEKKVLGIVFLGTLMGAIVSYSVPKIKENKQLQPKGNNFEASVGKGLNDKAKDVIRVLNPVCERDGPLDGLADEISARAREKFGNNNQEGFYWSSVQSSVRGLANSARSFVYSLELKDETGGRISCALIAFEDFVERVQYVHGCLKNLEGLNLSDFTKFLDEINKIPKKNYLNLKKR